MLPDFDSMSIEEIEAFRIAKREEMRALRVEIIASKEVYERKLALRYLGATLREKDLEHISAEDAAALVRIIRQSPREGDVVVEPEVGDLNITGKLAGV